jgi:Fe-S-cluster containining protein
VSDDREMERRIAALDRQVGRAVVREQRLLNRSFERLSELEAILLGLVDRLVAAGVVQEDDLVAAARQVEADAAARGEGLDHLVTLREDPPGVDAVPAEVDCSARMVVCHAVCCHLSVALSAEEVEAGRLRWDLGNPYRLRREADGRCTHQDRSTGWCGVYEDRPRPCRTYSCATDGRIWKDFAAMELNEEWLAANFRPDEPRFTPPRERELRVLRDHGEAPRHP